ncbi:hypothetical protein ACHAXH_002481 [Discostella pseudostelligera]
MSAERDRETMATNRTQKSASTREFAQAMSSSDNANESSLATENDEVIAPKDDGEIPPGETMPTPNKRRSDIQLSKEGLAAGGDDSGDDDDNLNDEGGKRSDPFKRASDDVLKNRKIVKVSSKWSNGKDGGNSVGGTFASIELTHTSPPKSESDSKSSSANGSNSFVESNDKVFFFASAAGVETGSDAAKYEALFGSGFGNVSNGFGSLKSSSASDNAESNRSSSNSTTFGGGFGSVSSGFGSLKSSSAAGGFGSASQPNAASSIGNATTSSNNCSFTGKLASSPEKASQIQFPTPAVVDIDNGEQDEDCVCQVRAKLFKMVPEDESADADEESISKGDVPSVPSTTGRMESVKAQKCNDISTEKEVDATAGLQEGGNKPKLVQKEAGIGPVRILKSKHPRDLGEDGEKAHAEQSSTARVVQRQETSGGGATRVILNIRLDKATCTVIRRGDKFVQLNAPNSCGAVESSLFKVKTTTEADTLEKALKDVLGLNGEDI